MRSNDALSVTQASCWVYFVRGGGLIKIGITTGTPTKRFRTIQAQSPVEVFLAAVMPGHPQDEKDLHERFAGTRAHYEWFHPCPEIEQLIADTITRYGEPDEALGVPTHLLSFADQDRAGSDEERHLAYSRSCELRRLYSESQLFLGKNQPIPDELTARMYKLRALVPNLQRENAA